MHHLMIKQAFYFNNSNWGTVGKPDMNGSQASGNGSNLMGFFLHLKNIIKKVHECFQGILCSPGIARAVEHVKMS